MERMTTDARTGRAMVRLLDGLAVRNPRKVSRVIDTLTTWTERCNDSAACDGAAAWPYVANPEGLTLSDWAALTTRDNSYVIYDGPSLITGEPIVAIATCITTPSDNEKTGRMVQTFIIPNNGKSPSRNVKEGTDTAACGTDDCVHKLESTCYVVTAQSVNSTWRAFMRGSHRPLPTPAVFIGCDVRFGSYGDPAALPLPLIREIATMAGDWTGYTHQWRHARVQPYAEFLMASVELASDRRAAKRLEWRTFRGVARGVDPTANPELDAALPYEMPCPATDNNPKVSRAGVRATCATCMACHGTSTATRSRCTDDIVLYMHGATGEEATYEQFVSAYMRVGRNPFTD